ncbi:hypothetical protein BDZ91DRAFT_698901 [Kalaharituber pfeilii]|nr:hypothetical protein BDZ91DRAFT_698901 [Kalaharituber pfeilii]
MSAPSTAVHAPTTPTPPSPPPRLSLPLPARLIFSTLLTFPPSFLLGLHQGYTTHSLRFRAENAHRLPPPGSPQAQWYLYHKSRTYAGFLGGIKEGVRNGFRVSFWVGVFLGAEEVVDRGRAGTAGGIDAGGTVVASLATAGAFCLYNGFNYSTTVRTAKKGLLFGLLYGVAQDLIRAAKGDGTAGWMRFAGRMAGWPVSRREEDKRGGG